ncbi:hypothetical protein [Litorimonas cladophorae]|nr:hypothetical protein [Litorimonas cladophorae]
MAFFRKKQQNMETSSDRRAKALDADNQAKWDELERLVSAKSERPEAEPSAIATTPQDDLSYRSETASTPSPKFGGHDLRETDTSVFASDLKVDMPADSTYLDVTPDVSIPEPTQYARPSFEAMMPSEAFKAPTTEARTASVENIQARAESISEPSTDASESFTPPPPPVRRPERADIGAMRLDVARISADIQSGEELYRRAQQRIENLTSFVERAEVDFSMLNRLEPENRRLKARNRTLEREIDANAQKIEVLRADLKDQENRLAEKSRVYETAAGRLAVVQKSLQEYERALKTSRESSDRNSLNAERLQTSLDVERRENEVLRDRLSTVVGEMDSKQTAYIEAKKIADSLAQDCADFRHQSETAEKDADALRKALATAQTQNNAMKAEMMGMHEDIRAFKTQSEFTIISREDEMTALQQQVDQLSKQLQIKDEIVRNAARDVQELRKIRTAQDLERERLEAHIQTQAYQLEQASSDLLQTKQDVTDFDRRYRDVATALSVSQARRMSNEPAAQPDIQPHVPDEFDDLSTEDIEDRIMDFRLGLRNEIT